MILTTTDPRKDPALSVQIAGGYDWLQVSQEKEPPLFMKTFYCGVGIPRYDATMSFRRVFMNRITVIGGIEETWAISMQYSHHISASMP